MAVNALPSPKNASNAPAIAGGGRPGLSAPQKAALIVASLGPEAAGPIIERIGDKHLRAFTRAYAHLQTVPQPVLKVVVEEFIMQLTREDNDIKGGLDETREFLGQFKTTDEIIRLMDGIDLPGGDSIWVKLERTGDEELAAYLAKQRPQIIAVILSKLNTEKASNVLNLIDGDLVGQVVLRLAKPLNVNPAAMGVLTETIEREFLAPMRKSTKGRNPGEMIGAMMNNIVSDKREGLLKLITESTPEIMKDVRKSMLTFQDIPTRVPPNAIPMAIKEVDLDDFLLAVKFGRQNAPSSVEFIFKNISQRMVAQYEEELEKLNMTSVRDAEIAQASFMAVIRKLAKSGEITLVEPASEDDEDEEASEGAEAGAAKEE